MKNMVEPVRECRIDFSWVQSNHASEQNNRPPREGLLGTNPIELAGRSRRSRHHPPSMSTDPGHTRVCEWHKFTDQIEGILMPMPVAGKKTGRSPGRTASRGGLRRIYNGTNEPAVHLSFRYATLVHRAQIIHPSDFSSCGHDRERPLAAIMTLPSRTVSSGVACVGLEER